MSGLFHTFIYDPIYNGLIYLIGHVPNYDVGIAIIVITVIVKLVLFPLSKTAVRTQILMKKLEPELNELKKKYEKDKQQQAQKMMQLYKDNNLNPFSGFLLILIQLPIIFGLYWVFFRGGLPDIDVSLLYSFVSVPMTVNMDFIGLIDMSGRSLLLAALAGITQFIQINYALPKMAERKDDPSLKEDLARSFQLQMRYVMPVMIAIFAYIISAAIALYWVTSNIFAIGQELYMRKRIKGPAEEVSQE